MFLIRVLRLPSTNLEELGAGFVERWAVCVLIPEW
jgi:hypothetical protein